VLLQAPPGYSTPFLLDGWNGVEYSTPIHARKAALFLATECNGGPFVFPHQENKKNCNSLATMQWQLVLFVGPQQDCFKRFAILKHYLLLQCCFIRVLATILKLYRK